MLAIQKKNKQARHKADNAHDEENNKKEISEKLNIKWTERLSYNAIKRQS